MIFQHRVQDSLCQLLTNPKDDFESKNQIIEFIVITVLTGPVVDKLRIDLPLRQGSELLVDR